MKRKVVFVGGPACGRTAKWREEDLAEYIVLELDGKRYHYKHKLLPVTEGSLRIQHRFMFLGYNPTLPDWLHKEMAQRKEEGQEHGE